MYTAPIADVIKRHGMRFHFYADDTPIYLSFNPLDASQSKSLIEECIQDVQLWMVTNKLKLNGDKTELLVLTARQRPEPPLDSIKIGPDIIKASKSAKNIGVWLDSVLSMDVQINNICKTAFYHLRNIAKMRKFLTHRQCEILIHALVSLKLDYCNVLLSGLQQSRIDRLQHVQNSAARLLTATSRYDHVTPVLRSLHWLPVSARIDFKILLLVFKVLNGLGPLYLSELLEPYIPNRNLRSAKKKLLVVPKYNLRTYEYRAFSHRAPTLWNALPDDIRQVDKIQANMESFNEKAKKMEETIHEIEAGLTFTNKDIEEIKRRENQTLDKIQGLEDQILYQEVYSRRENLRLFGLPEEGQGSENTCEVVYKFLENELELEEARNIEFQRVHRLGKKKAGQSRPIIVRFLRFPERELVFRNVRDLGEESDVKAYADFPKEIRDRRKKLWPKLKQAREDGKVAFFDKREPDKLYINGILST